MIKFWIRYGLDFAGIRWVLTFFRFISSKINLKVLVFVKSLACRADG
jgi:hypothetical protein